MYRDATITRLIADLFHDLGGRNRASGHIVSILEFNESGLRPRVAEGGDHLLNFRPSQNTIFAPRSAQHAAGEESRHSHFPVENVRALLANDLLTGTGVHLDGDLISHRSRGHKQGSIALKDVSCGRLKSIDSRVFTVYVVSHLSFGHRPAHGRRWTRDSLPAQID